MTQRELGTAVGLSPNAAGVRVQRLVERGVIRRFGIDIDHGRLGRPLEAAVDVWLTNSSDTGAFAEIILDDDRVVDCFHPTGPLDFCIQVRVASSEDLFDLLTRLKTEGGVRQTDSRLVLERRPTERPSPSSRSGGGRGR